MASPHVAGAVALLWSAFPNLRGDVDHTEFILEQTAVHLTTTQGCGGDTSSQVPNNVYGYGRIDVLAAYNYAANEVTATPTPTSVISPTPSNTPTATFTPTNTPTRTPSPTPTNTPSVSTTGFLSPSAQAAVTKTAGDNNGYELNPANAFADGGGFAQDVNSGTNTNSSCTNNGKDKHIFSNYNISLPAGATVAGFEVRLDALVDSVGANAPALCVQFSWDGGKTWTAAKQTSALTTSEASYFLGSPSDTWGRTWTVSNLSNANFRVRVSDLASGSGANSRDFSLDWVAVRVTYR
jgi:hypothetical protein